MTDAMRFRCTAEDIQQIEDKARKMGINKSAYIRIQLIKAGVIKA